jgi:ligand-binding sensor domain-containing protein
VQHLRLHHLGLSVVSLLLLAVIQRIFSQPNFWQASDGSTIGIVHSLAVNSTVYIFAGTESGVYRSMDNGESWTPVNTGLITLTGCSGNTVTFLAASPNGHIFASANCSGGLFRSTDNGGNWSHVKIDSTNPYVGPIAINLRGDIFVGIYPGIFRSTDDGSSWRQVDSVISPRALAVSSDGDIVAASVGGDIFRSTDNGDSWTQVRFSDGNGLVESILVTSKGHVFAGLSLNSYGAVLHSTDNGVTWRYTGFELRYCMGNYGYDCNYYENCYYYPVFTIVADSGGDLYAGSENGVYRSTDDGASWIPGGLEIANVTSLAVNPGGQIFAGIGNDASGVSSSGRGIFRSTDAGGSWTALGSDLKSSAISSLVTDDHGRLLAGTLGGGGIFGSTDNGLHWSYNSLRGVTVSTVTAKPGGQIFAGTRSPRYGYVQVGNALRSSDNGESWTEINNGLPSQYISCFRYPVGDIQIAVGPAPVSSLSVDSVGNVFSVANNFVLRSTDDGASWIPTGLGSSSKLVVNSNGHIFAGTATGDGSISRSTDHGGSWENVTLLGDTSVRNNYINTFAANTGGHLFAGTSKGIFRSTDDGLSWTQLNSGLTDTTVLSIAVDADGECFAGTLSGGVFRSTDDGASWTQTNTGLTRTSIYSLAVNSDHYVFAGTDSGIFRSALPGTIVAEIYPGDANNDGVVDVRDILPIGRYFGMAGPVRQNGSDNWTAQPLVTAWNSFNACYADCNGDGRVDTEDVASIIRNWHATRTAGLPGGINQVQVCEELLEEIDSRQPVRGAMREIRNVIVAYMKRHLGIVLEFNLEQNWPNPFNPTTRIRFTVPEEVSQVRLSIYDILGHLVWEKLLVDVQTGRHEIEWSGENGSGAKTASGLYLYRLSAGRYTDVKRMVLLK